MADTFEMQFRDDIQERMVSELNKLNDKTKIEGGFSRDIINANSVEFENAYAEMNLIVEAAFADTSWGEYLTKICAEYGVDRKEAAYATGTVTFTGTGGTVVPAGTLVQTADRIQYKTDDDVTIASGTADATVTAVVIGSTGNVKSGTVTEIPLAVSGVHAVTNAAPMENGYDEESDDDLRTRYYIAVRTPATSGNVYHYYNWAMAVDGVGSCKINPLRYGNGTVQVLIIDSNGKTASADLIAAVKAYIEERRPIGATVYVESPEPYIVNVSVDIDGTLDVDAFKEAATAYFVKRANTEGQLSANMLSKYITKQDTVADYAHLRINGAKHVTLTDMQLPVIGEVTTNVLVED